MVSLPIFGSIFGLVVDPFPWFSFMIFQASLRAPQQFSWDHTLHLVAKVTRRVYPLLYGISSSKEATVADMNQQNL